MQANGRSRSSYQHLLTIDYLLLSGFVRIVELFIGQVITFIAFAFRLTRYVAVRIVELFIGQVIPFITQIQLSFIQ